ncbi:ADAMTS-like protein 3 [Copidosoma floridanum]|uniref:ADAMTS-like protein 3 n=1 Tax=Copidosoma floridanum TaxID=29053 RepID=UPI000C6FBBD6|nr:ADAMTS-like protein 3 [Copidosoma floridanum]
MTDASDKRDFLFFFFLNFDLALLQVLLLVGIVASDNSTVEGSLEVANAVGSYETDQALYSLLQGSSSGEWTPCSRSCGGGLSKQQKQRCRRKPCKSRNIKYKVCNVQPCANGADPRSEQCSAFNSVPYSDQLLMWYPYYDPSRPCALICRGEQLGIANGNDNNNGANLAVAGNNKGQRVAKDEEYDSDESIVVQLAEKVQDGTRCFPDAQDVCINGKCMGVGCDLRVGGSKSRDVCGVCGGDSSTCNVKYAWTLESTSACSESCGGGFKTATSVCKTTGPEETVVDSSKCDTKSKPDEMLLPCNSHPCPTKWLSGEWSICSVPCGGGSRSRPVFCIEENGNATSKLPDYKCNASRKPKYQEICNAFSCPMWEPGEWSECSASCGGTGTRTRKVECRDGNGRVSSDCDPAQRPKSQQECRAPANADCSTYADEMMQAYPLAPVPEKLIDQPVPSQSTFVADEWSACSASCGEGVRHRQVHCKIYLEFSRTIAKLPDHQCTGPKPPQEEKCALEPCHLLENSLAYRIDPVGDSSYAESSDGFRSSSSALASAVSSYTGGGGSGGGYEGNVKVASGSSVKTTYSWQEAGYTDCSATCLGGVQELIITCVRDDTKKAVMPLLCTAETKPELRTRICNDHPCPPRWNTSEFSDCSSPCGLGIQTREVTCLHEVTRGPGNTVTVPSQMCPQPPPVDRQYCNVFDCPPEWQAGEWGKCSKTCGGGVKRRKVVCEQTMAQGRKIAHTDGVCSASKPRAEKECNSRACEQLAPGAQPVIVTKNATYVQDDPNKKVNLDIGGRATIFQGTPIIKIRCPVKKFDKAHIVWRKDHEELRKSRKHKINKKGALKIVDIGMADSGIYSCWAGQTSAALYLTVKPKSRDLMSNEEVLRSGNAVHQRQGAQLSSAPVNSEPYYGIYGEESSQENQQRSNGWASTTEKPQKRKKQKQTASPSPSDSTGKYDYSVTPLHQPVESSVPSGASTLVPHLSQLVTTIKSYWSPRDQPSPSYRHAATGGYHESRATLPATIPENNGESGGQFGFLRGNTVIPDNTFGPDEERIFIDDDSFDADETVFEIEHREEKEERGHRDAPTVTMVSFDGPSQPTRTRHHHGSTESSSRHAQGRNQRGTSRDDEVATDPSQSPYVSSESMAEDELQKLEANGTSIGDVASETMSVAMTTTAALEAQVSESTEEEGEEEEETEAPGGKLGREMMRNVAVTEAESTTSTTTPAHTEPGKSTVAPLVLSNENENHEPTIGSVGAYGKAKDDLVFEWVTTDWSRCSQTCGGGGFQMRGAQCTVRSAKNDSSETKVAPRTVIGASLCEDAGYPMPEKVRPCGGGRCPQWNAGEWSSCESSRCFTWKTAMQRREISCRLVEESEDKSENVTVTDPSKCDEAVRPPQRRECYNDACKGVWRVNEWSDCDAPCEKDGIKYRMIQCVWYGTKKPAGNACRDIPRPPVMKTCRGPPCHKTSEDCKDHSPLCRRVKQMSICRMPFYGKQCCETCKLAAHNRSRRHATRLAYFKHLRRT